MISISSSATQYKDLYKKTEELRKEWDHIFAKYTCDRKTLNIKPVNLGIKPEYRNKNIRIELIHFVSVMSKCNL